MKHLTLVVISLLLFACGGENKGGQDNPTGAPTAAPRPDRCDLAFSSEGLCADLEWKVGPSADSDNQLEVKFHAKGSEVLAEPKGEVGSFVRMTCCGSLSFPKVQKVATGVYHINKIRFVPGNWEVYVQLKKGEAVEKHAITLDVE